MCLERERAEESEINVNDIKIAFVTHSSPLLSAHLLSTVFVTCGQPQLKNIKWEFQK